MAEVTSTESAMLPMCGARSGKRGVALETVERKRGAETSEGVRLMRWYAPTDVRMGREDDKTRPRARYSAVERLRISYPTAGPLLWIPGREKSYGEDQQPNRMCVNVWTSVCGAAEFSLTHSAYKRPADGWL